ncbi:MAG: oligosaccharide flippase family protein [Chitinophagales bacterium]
MSKTSSGNSIFKHFSILFLGLLAVQIINFLFSLVLPKFFTPVDFAEFGIFTSILFILIEVTNAKLDIAVMLPVDIQQSERIINASFTVTCLFFVALLLICIPLSILYYKIYLLLPFAVLAYGIHQPILVYLNKKSDYSSINLFRLLQVIVTIVFTLVIAFLKIPHALVYGFLLGIATASVFLLRYYRPVFNLSELKEVWKEYDQFPKYGTWSSLLNNISRNSIPILLTHFFTKNMVGFYAYATRLLNAPTGMYKSAMGQVYFKIASDLNNEELKKATMRILFYTFLLGIIPTLILLFYGQQLFLFLFSSEWTTAGKISQYLILWYFLNVITSPVSSLIDIKNKLQFELKFNAVMFIVRILSIVIGGYLNDFYFSMALYSITGVILNLYLIYYIRYKLLVE